MLPKKTLANRVPPSKSRPGGYFALGVALPCDTLHQPIERRVTFTNFPSLNLLSTAILPGGTNR